MLGPDFSTGGVGTPARAGAPASVSRLLSRRLAPGAGVLRATRSLPAILQIVLAATAAYAFSSFVLGHQYAVLSVTVTISSLGFGRDARPKRVAETALGMTFGVAVSETLLLLWGTGVWQLSVVLAITLFVARLLSPTATFAVAAGVQAMLVTVLPAAPDLAYTRSIDSVVGGLAALLFTALIPRSPARVARQDGRELFAVLSSTLAALVSALRSADERAAERTLARLRATQPLIDDWAQALDSAIGVARLSPFLRGQLGELERQRTMLTAMDLATRNLRVVARRADFLVRDRVQRPELAELLASVSTGVNLLGQSLSDPTMVDLARQDLTLVAVGLDPQRIVPGGRMADKTLVVIVRPLVVDLLTATGVPADEARAMLPRL